MIDKLFAISLILNMTGLFRFVAPQIGVSIGRVSMVLLALNVFYLLVKLGITQRLLVRGHMGGLLLVLVLWPLCTLLWAPAVQVREIGLMLFFFSLVFGTAVYTVRNGLAAIHRVLLISLLISLAGIAMSMMMPGYFAAVALAADAVVPSDGTGRAFGFFLQPNSMAIGMIFLFIGWLACWRGKNSMMEVAATMGLVLVILLSGSRTGMLITALLVFLRVASFWRSYVTHALTLFKLIALGTLVIISAVAIRQYVSSKEVDRGTRQADLLSRMQMLLSFRLSGEESLLKDKSVMERMEAQETYIELIAERPLTGHGVGANAYLKEKGIIGLSAHSDALIRTLENGVLYPFAFALVMLQLYFSRRRREIEQALGVNSITQFVLLLLITFVINGIIMDSRVFYSVLGVFAAIVYSPQFFFTLDPATGKIVGRRDAAVMVSPQPPAILPDNSLQVAPGLGVNQ